MNGLGNTEMWKMQNLVRENVQKSKNRYKVLISMLGWFINRYIKFQVWPHLSAAPDYVSWSQPTRKYVKYYDVTFFCTFLPYHQILLLPQS